MQEELFKSKTPYGNSVWVLSVIIICGQKQTNRLLDTNKKILKISATDLLSIWTKNLKRKL